MKRNELADLSAFAAVAEERSFTRAAIRLGVSPSALSHSMRGLEKSLGIQLLARTTRSVSATSAGTALLAELSPALERINLAVAETRKQREKPAGRIRLIIPRAAIDLVLMPKLSRFVRNYPDITLEVTNSSDPVDLVAGEFDAGIQIGEFIHRDMIAVPVTKELRLAIVGSPAYFQSNPVPQRPADLKSHSCVGFRFSSGVYRWEFEKGRTAVTVSPQGPVSFDESDLVAQAVLSGIGVGAVLEESVKELILKGKLKQVLQDWCPVFPGFFLYYPSRRNQPGALAALIHTLRLEDGPS